MDTTKCRTRNSDVSNITAQELQWNVEMLAPLIKQETIQNLDEEEISQCMDHEETFCNNHMNEELSQVIERQEFKQEHSEESLSVIKNEVIDDELYPVIVKIESLEEHRVMDNFGDAGVHYDVLVTPQPVQCKLCSRSFKNRYTLLIHNYEHIKVVLYPTPVDIVMNKLHKCKYCHEHFDSRNNMLAHVRDVHRNKRLKSKLYCKPIKPYLTRKNGKKMEYKCDLCERIYKSKDALEEHTKKIHVYYGRMFECWCGKQFRTPIHLIRHKRRQHNPNVKKINNEQFQCDSCNKFFKTKPLLIAHIKRMHYDYGKTFECSCGQQFPSLIHLSHHKNDQHSSNVRIISNQKFQCDSCHKAYKTKHLLVVHIKRIHYDYGKTFGCYCGKQFRTPLHLYQHNQQVHCPDGKVINNEVFQCHICQKLIKKKYLTGHIKSVHYDYFKTFECSCGRQFRSPIHLSKHKDRSRCGVVKKINNQRCQCDTCHKYFNTRSRLVEHEKRMHYDYGKKFECWCGKQFRTPNHIYQHKKRQH